MRIRRYRDEDAEAKKQLHMKVIEQVNSRDYSSEQIDAWTTFDQSNARDEEKTKRWVAVKDDKIIGFGDYVPCEAEVTGIYVHPDYLRQGIASELLETIEEDAREEGLEELTLVSTITARGFYEDKGYELMEKIMYETSGEELETFRMRKDLD